MMETACSKLCMAAISSSQLNHMPVRAGIALTSECRFTCWRSVLQAELDQNASATNGTLEAAQMICELGVLLPSRTMHFQCVSEACFCSYVEPHTNL